MRKEVSDKLDTNNGFSKTNLQQQNTNYIQNLREQNQSVKDTNYRLPRDALYSQQENRK